LAELKVTVSRSGDSIVARFVGEALIDQMEEFERQLRLMAQLAPATFVFDFSGLTAISSMGLGALICFRNEVAPGGSRLKLAAPSASVWSALRNAKFERVFEIANTVEEAASSPPPQG
jgi:anti-anti-sigma factor